jgi:hypothetical protein
MNMAHIKQFLDSVQMAQQTNNQRIILTLPQAQNLALEIGKVLATAFDKQSQDVEVTFAGGSFTDK